MLIRPDCTTHPGLPIGQSVDLSPCGDILQTTFVDEADVQTLEGLRILDICCLRHQIMDINKDGKDI